jgi:SNF2 family DNA or RNA helicase
VRLGQIEAGGVGVNIQSASVVVITEPQWKPSTENQAVARAHRMGQIRTVQVHRLLAKSSVDERMREIQENKTRSSSRRSTDSVTAPTTVEITDDTSSAIQVIAR